MSDQKKLFENKTTYQTEDYIRFLEFHNQKYRISYFAYTIFWSFLFLLCIFFAFTSGLRMQGVLSTLILICFLCYRILKPKMTVQKELKSDKLDGKNTNTFSFYEKEFVVQNPKGKFRYQYFMLYRIFETKDFFYLYATKENAFLVSKQAFSLGNAKDFAFFLKKKCQLKYKGYQKLKEQV